MQKRIYLGLVCLLLSGCIHSHDRRQPPPLQAQLALRFAQIAFVNKDFDKAYDLLSESGKKYGSVEDFRKFVAQKHPKGFPVSVKITDFEPAPEQKDMIIYAYGENGAEKFYYRLIVDGVQETDFKVSGFNRSDTPYPQTDKRLPVDQ